MKLNNSRCWGAVLSTLLLAACATQPDRTAGSGWQTGDYRLQLSEQGLRVEHEGAPFALIDSFEFNFVHGEPVELTGKGPGKAVLSVAMDGGDGYSEDFPERVEVAITHADGRFHFEAEHPTFHHISINLMDRDEHYFGLLEKLYPDNRKNPDLRGETVDVDVYHQGERDYAENYASAFSAFYLSSAGYGSFFDTFAKGRYRFAQDGLTRIYHQTDALDWYLFHGPDGASVHRRYFEVIGEPKSVPIWALGPVVWRDHNTGKDEILSDPRRLPPHSTLPERRLGR